VHQWGNPGNEPLTFITFNINPEGVAAVLPGAPKKTFPNAPASTGRTLESLRPSKPEQILPARFVIGETLFQFHQCSRIILFHALTLYVGGGGVK
jgi:hypothetical protein